MTATTKLQGSLVIPHGTNIIHWLSRNNGSLEILWSEKDLQQYLETMSFHSDPELKPTILPVVVEIPLPDIEPEMFQEVAPARAVLRARP